MIIINLKQVVVGKMKFNNAEQLPAFKSHKQALIK